MKHLLYKEAIFLLFVFPLSSYGQQSKIDSLKRAIQLTKEDTSKVNVLYQLSYAQEENNPKKAIVYANQGIELSKRIGYKKGISICLNSLGNSNVSLGEYQAALNYYSQRYAIVSDMKDSAGVASTCDNLGIVFLALGNIDTALELRTKAVKIYSTLNKQAEIANANVWIGNIYKEQSNYPTALENYLEALRIFDKLNDTLNSGYSLLGISSVYRLTKQYALAKKYALEAIATFTKSNYSKGIGAALYRLSLVFDDENSVDSSTKYLLMAKKIFEKIDNKPTLTLINNQLENQALIKGDYSTALEYFNIALAAAKQMNEKSTMASALGEIGIVYKELKQYSKALDYMTKSRKLFEELNNKGHLKSLAAQFIDYYSRTHQPDSVIGYLNKYQELSDSLYSEQRNKAVAEMEKKYETEKKDNQIQLLNKDKKIRERKIREQSKNIILIALAAVLLLLISIFIFWRQRILHSLKTQQLETKILRSQLNPHFIGNSLIAIRKYIRMDPEKAEGYFDKYSTLMRDVLVNSEKEFISLDEELSMLKRYMDIESIRLENGFDYKINIDPEVDPEMINIPPLILQPIVENAIKHGIAGRSERGEISIHASMENSALRCTIENSCEGSQTVDIEPKDKTKSFGLKISKERLRLLAKAKRKKWYLETIPLEQGWRVLLGIPL